jgi:hypothetical protein
MRPTPLSDRTGDGEAADVLEFDFNTPAYAEFSKSLEAQLTRLVETWQHLAAPRALRVGRMVSRSGNTSSI